MAPGFGLPPSSLQPLVSSILVGGSSRTHDYQEQSERCSAMLGWRLRCTALMAQAAEPQIQMPLFIAFPHASIPSPLTYQMASDTACSPKHPPSCACGSASPQSTTSPWQRSSCRETGGHRRAVPLPFEMAFIFGSADIVLRSCLSIRALQSECVCMLHAKPPTHREDSRYMYLGADFPCRLPRCLPDHKSQPFWPLSQQIVG